MRSYVGILEVYTSGVNMAGILGEAAANPESLVGARVGCGKGIVPVPTAGGD